MKKLTLLLLIAISCGFYTGVRAQVNVTSVSEKNDADNFYKMMKEAFPLSFNDPASPRFVFFNKNKNFVFGVGGFVQVQGIYDFNGVPNDNYFTTNTIALKGEQSGDTMEQERVAIDQLHDILRKKTDLREILKEVKI